MSDALRLLVVGATGLVGGRAIEEAQRLREFHLLALSRRELGLPLGTRIEVLLADPANWPSAIAQLQPDVVICALGTTWAKSGQDEAAFRAVDQYLVLAVAKAAKAAGAQRFVLVSSVGADLATSNFYLRVKGEVERDIGKVGFDRLTILRPGLLRGPRGGERRVLERLGIILSPLTNLFLHGQYRKYRSIDGRVVARAALQACLDKRKGRFVLENDGIHRAAGELERAHPSE
ncbi:NAD(P)H-binding protein [Paraurantiacibacter namhicola]|uniref:NAD dependent epimerase/dehydratase family protein n=1 Tax=Paraurantiacibacter namhicola TaxID=645517 RepID=A0A1C7D879_9SPHN|nr:NAD(P)H-binding protein [Paraurantiacibacter namhicola]ANU07521.1 NAD dependent epimerase/dehydratase family protein [Paraurantiacibacter namhicola]